ncbi:hypothetical protein [Lactococcus garvieae]|uniref:hypothetical protein n=1 Tax=Lactococcus garvieae TaxID=1363 RepID=UPI0030CF48A9
MEKLNLKSEDIRLSTLELDKDLFELPKQLLIDFSQARYGYLYVKGNKTDTIEKVKLISIDKAEADKLESVGLEVKDYMRLPVEIEDFKSIEGLMDSEEILTVELFGVRVKLQVENFRPVGYKLIARSLKVVEAKDMTESKNK